MLVKWMVSVGLIAALAGCAHAPASPGPDPVHVPVMKGWFAGVAMLCLTTDASHAEASADKGANFAPRLADALPDGPPQPGRRLAADKEYMVAHYTQPSIFALAP